MYPLVYRKMSEKGDSCMEKDMLKFARALFVMHGVTDEPKRVSGGWTNWVFAAGG